MLTEEEHMDLLALRRQGWTNAEIAEELSVFETIRAEGFAGSYPSVAREVRRQRGPRFRRARR